jgi:hypothetical protein
VTKHTLFTFQLHRRGVIMIAIGAVLVALLLVLFGFLLGRFTV